jgi:hypothetical protein
MKKKIALSLVLAIVPTLITLLSNFINELIPSSPHSFIPCSLSAQIPADGLVAWYPFNGNANDESGNGIVSENIGGVFSNDRNNNQMAAYNSTLGYVTATSNLLNTNSFSYSAWVNPSLLTNGLGDIGGTYFDYQGYFVGISNGIPHVRIHSSQPNSDKEVLSNEPITSNSWSLITATFESSELKLYVNGVLKGSLATGSFIFVNRGVLAIGRSPWVLNFSTASFPGLVDDVAIYNRALTPSEIQQLYQDQTGQVQQPLTCNITAPVTSICEGESITLSMNTTDGAGSSSQLPANLQQGLVANYPFEDGALGEASIDGMAEVSADRFGQSNGAYSLANSGYINLGNGGLTSNPSSYSMSLWFKSSALSQGLYDNTSVLITRRHMDWGPTWTTLQIVNSGNLALAVDGPAYSNVLNSNINVLDNQWHHVVGVKNGSNYILYLDGAQVGNLTDNYAHAGSSQDFHLGHDGAWNTNFIGSFDDVSIYNRAIDSIEVVQIYNQIASSIDWSTGATTSSITVTPTANTTYGCTVTQGTQACTASVDITLNPNVTSAISATIIEGETYTLGAQNLNTAGTYTEVFTSATGCDSTVTLTLSLEPLLTCDITAPVTSICDGESVTLSVNTTGGAGSSSQLPANLQQGLVAYYPFNGNANDESGNGNNGVVNGATLTADRFGNSGKAYNFEQTGNLQNISVNIPESISPYQSPGYSYSFWMNSQGLAL